MTDLKLPELTPTEDIIVRDVVKQAVDLLKKQPVVGSVEIKPAEVITKRKGKFGELYVRIIYNYVVTDTAGFRNPDGPQPPIGEVE